MMIRSFTQSDHDAFNGAEPFPNGDQPIISDLILGHIVIADGNGVQILENTEDMENDGCCIWSLALPMPSAVTAEVFVRGLLSRFHHTMITLHEIGFRQIG